MALHTFRAMAAYDPTAGELVRDGALQVFAVSDTARATPLPALDLNGLPLAAVRSSRIGVTQDFQVEGHDVVVLKSGPYEFTVASFEGMRDAAKAAAEQAKVNVDSAAQVAADAAVASATSTIATKVQQSTEAVVPGLVTTAVADNPEVKAEVSALIVDRDLVAGEKFGGLIPSPLQEVVRKTLGTTDPWVCDAIGGTFYGSKQGRVWASTDRGQTWTDVCAMPTTGTILGLRATDDGEVLAVMAGGVWKSAGWGTATVTWAQKVTSNGLAGPQAFGFDGNGQKFIVAEYGPGSGQAWVDSRYAYISTDAGETFTRVFDSDAETGNAPVDSHVHGCCYDPWNDTFYVSEGHSTGGGIYHSTDDGATWQLAPGMAIGQAGSASPTSITATDDGLVIGSDSDNSQGVYGVVRTADPMDQQLTWLWAWRAPRSGNNGWGAKGVRDPRTGLVYIAWKTQGANVAPLITGGTPYAAEQVWEWPGTTFASEDVFEYLALNNAGELAAFATVGGQQIQVTGRLSTPSASRAVDRGGVLGGRAGDATSLASGRDATTGTALRALAAGVGAVATQDSVAVGSGAKATQSNEVVVGAGATGTGSSVTVGQAAKTVGGASVAVGAGAETTGGNGTAVGRNAKAASTNLAAGYGAQAVVGSNAVALGAANTGSHQIAGGNRYLELGEVAAITNPGADKGRIGFRDNGAGKTELVVVFPTGAAIILATEP